jgi:hypothetical protein
VEPAARLDRLEIIRVFDYGNEGIAAPEAAAPVPSARKGR